jgi:LPXTG-motif cell wall-anchored protein
VEVEQLPQTASPLPLIGLLGMICLGGAAALRRFATARI